MMAESQAFANFVSKKISKIRWKPTSKNVVQTATVFASGSWDDNENEVCVWHVDEILQDVSSYTESEAAHVDSEPVLVTSIEHRGDVTDLLFLEHDNIVTSSSTGEVFVYKFDQLSQRIQLQHNYGRVHRYEMEPASSCPCTGLASRGDEMIASVGQDGRLNLLSLETALTSYSLSNSIENADSCTLNAVCFLTQTEVAAVNSIGQFKIWDNRQSNDEPVRVFVLTGEQLSLNCMDRHPTQPHIVATGVQDGTLCLWDMRQEKYPITLLAAHSSDMWEVHFHPSQPSHLFTCSNDGSLWHWVSSDSSASHMLTSNSNSSIARGVNSNVSASSSSSTAVNSWLMGDATRRNLVINELLAGNPFSVNSLDVVGSSLLCATDAEQICLIRGLAIY